MIQIGILGGAEIAHRMFLPALIQNENFICGGIASKNPEKRQRFAADFHIPVYNTYEDLIDSPKIEALYIPLPPALHYQWAKQALKHGKHVFLEKPSTVSFSRTQELVKMADTRKLVLQENYMFQYHTQLKEIQKLLISGDIGKIRLIKSSFGFPLRGADDFRYQKALGGGALLDAGGYVVKLATLFLGSSVKVKTACLNSWGYDVDMFGSVTLENDVGMVFQGSFGMDCYYQCSLEIWGSKGRLYTNRIFTAPPTLAPKVTIETNNGTQELVFEPDNHFAESIQMYYNAIKEDNVREKMYNDMLLQANLIEHVKKFNFNGCIL